MPQEHIFDFDHPKLNEAQLDSAKILEYSVYQFASSLANLLYGPTPTTPLLFHRSSRSHSNPLQHIQVLAGRHMAPQPKPRPQTPPQNPSNLSLESTSDSSPTTPTQPTKKPRKASDKESWNSRQWVSPTTN